MVLRTSRQHRLRTTLHRRPNILFRWLLPKVRSLLQKLLLRHQMWPRSLKLRKLVVENT